MSKPPGWLLNDVYAVLDTMAELPSGRTVSAIGPLVLCMQLAAVLVHTMHENYLEEGRESDLEDHVEAFEAGLRAYLAQIVARAEK